jgi:Concanavalin A-like lectin/glucanases superfamily
MMAGTRDYPPSFKQGSARCAAESEFPKLWKGLVGAWSPALGPSGERLLDRSGGGRTAVNNSPYITWQASERGTVLYSGAGVDTSCITIPAWTTGATFSIAMYAKLDDASPAWQAIASDGTETGYGFYIRQDNLCWLGPSTNYSTPAHLVTTGIWHLFGISVLNGIGTFWMDGIPCGQATVNSYPLVRIIRSTYSDQVRGWVSFLGFWNRPLTAFDWRRLFAEPHCLFTPRRASHGSGSRRPYGAFRRILTSTYGVSP